jgi:hypothetical protein
MLPMITPTTRPAITAIAAFMFPKSTQLSAKEAIITIAEEA